jgi:hypothetical protein
MAEIIYEWILLIFRYAGPSHVVTFVTNYSGIRFFPFLVATLRFLKLLNRDSSTHLSGIQKQLIAAGKLVNCNAHGAALRCIATFTQLKLALDLAVFSGDGPETLAITQALDPPPTRAVVAPSSQPEFEEMPDIVQESVDDNMFEPIDPITPDVYALWEPIAPTEGDDEGFEPIEPMESSDSQFAQEFEPIPDMARQPSNLRSELIDLLMNPSPPSPPPQPERAEGDDSDDLIKF